MSAKEINSVRRLIYNKGAYQIGKGYKHWYNGKQVKYITLEYKDKKKDEKVYKIKHYRVPELIYNKAEQTKKFKPYETIKDPKNKNNVRLQKFKGKYTREEIRNYSQEISNKLLQRGKEGNITVALEIWGSYRSGGLTRFGDNVKVFNPDEYNFMEDELPDHFSGFSLIYTY